MKLDPEHESLLQGESGQAVALAAKTLVEYGRAFGAKRLVPVASGHLAGSFGILWIDAYLEILDRLVAEGARFRVPTTLNPRPGAERGPLNRFAFRRQERLEKCLGALGVTPNFSCVCYAGANVPKLGDRLGWAESSAVQFANSVLGARSNRNSLVIDVCSAVTGLTPEFGYLLDENRRGQVLVRLQVERMDASALGFLVGREVVNKVPVIEHHPFSWADLKNMGGSMAASGGVALFHVEGVTPEAPSLEAVFDGGPRSTLTITQNDLDRLRASRPDSADMVVFGCPHMTEEEADTLGRRFEGKRVRRPTWFCMAPESLERFRKSGTYGALVEAGVEVNTHCPLGALTMAMGRKRILTSSGKLFYYLQGAEYGNEEDCLRACGVD